MSARDWIAAYAAELGVEPPTDDEFATLLDLAGEAAHSSERVAAPVACWLSARAGIPLERAIELARDIGDHAARD